MVGDDVLAAARDEDELLDPGLAGFLDRVLDDWLIDDGKHLLGHRLGGGEKARAHPGDGEDRFADGLNTGHVCRSLLCVEMLRQSCHVICTIVHLFNGVRSFHKLLSQSNFNSPLLGVAGT